VTADTAPATAPDNKKKNLKRILAALFAIFIILLAALLYYLFTQRPVTNSIPGTLSQGPRFVKSVFGNFTDLTGVAVNRKGDRFYVCDGTAQKVWIISNTGAVLGSFGKAGTPDSVEGFGAPTGVAVGAKDEVYVADRLGARVLVYSPTGKFIKRFIPAKTPFEWSPLGIATDKQGNIYIADTKKGEHRILKFDVKGNLLLTIGKQGDQNGQFNFPNAVGVASDGTIYVCDSNNVRVQVFNAKGKFLRKFSGTSAGALTHPTGIDAIYNNEIHIVESFGHDIQVYNKNGASLYNFGKFGIADGEFRYPKGIAIAPDGTVLISDHDNKRLQIWKY
jgi:DNA-binding beta-propeller fold protein YncE